MSGLMLPWFSDAHPSTPTDNWLQRLTTRTAHALGLGRNASAGGVRPHQPLAGLLVMNDAASLRLVFHAAATTQHSLVADEDGMPTPLSIKIEDASGHSVMSVEDPTPELLVSLPAGDYCVTTRHGEVERRYSLHLDPSSLRDVHVRLTQGARI